MNEASIIQYIKENFANVEVVEASGDYYIFNDPNKKFPFATLVTGDRHDTFSNLNREGVFRLNVGVSKQTFQKLFEGFSGEHDFTALDRIMPHPVYGKMYWISVLNPSDGTFEKIKTFIQEAYEISAKRHARP